MQSQEGCCAGNIVERRSRARGDGGSIGPSEWKEITEKAALPEKTRCDFKKELPIGYEK